MEKTKKMLKALKGFTLIELIIVIAILGILAAIAAPSIFGYVKQSQIKADVATAKAIENAVKMALVMKKDTYLDPATGDVLPAQIAGIKTDAATQLGGGTIPSPKQNGYNFYVFLSKTKEYKVISWDGTTTTGLSDNYAETVSPALWTSGVVGATNVLKVN